MTGLTCFKAYDIRGQLGIDLDEGIAYRIGRAFAQFLSAKRLVVGGDIRLSTESLKAALIRGINDAGADVIDLGLTGTEEVYFASFHLDVDGGIEVTASHNPMNYNGMKMVGRGALPISGDSGLREIQRLAEQNEFITPVKKGTCIKQSILQAYCDHLLGYLDLATITPCTLVVNAGNGAAGHVIDELEKRFNKLEIPVHFIKINHEPDGHFPNGIPNPLLPENRSSTANAVIQHQATMGIAWDGDFDRCFLFDEKGQFIEGYYIVGLLAATFLNQHPAEKIIYDPRLTWNTIDVVSNAGGLAIQSKTGHAFIKERMRQENAIYGGEMSAHHYFRDFAYCDSGMIPWLLVIELLSKTGKTLSQLVKERMSLYPCSGELNYKVTDVNPVLERVLNYYSNTVNTDEEVPHIDKTDGLSLEFSKWRMNIRASNTEPLLRLNIESRGCHSLVSERVREVESLINAD
ncbi:phosphomannomutase [Legionella birminghamensis]|uniref:phosphomannomutase n=1 Tax=Legionella birminghamensis TaxID=28083 RepID=A0A378I4Y3_9GAMM|nr:phosphomannomutase/phosphoglucomutase [Legionella birminghamensis]KTC68757.1 phosphomannomutase [Legionella birminghamensis]STX30257.1 phosphomannomutase [Legionella birminghamensis]